jgi:hypothetical protein
VRIAQERVEHGVHLPVKLLFGLCCHAFESLSVREPLENSKFLIDCLLFAYLDTLPIPSLQYLKHFIHGIASDLTLRQIFETPIFCRFQEPVDQPISDREVKILHLIVKGSHEMNSYDLLMPYWQAILSVQNTRRDSSTHRMFSGLDGGLFSGATTRIFVVSLIADDIYSLFPVGIWTALVEVVFSSEFSKVVLSPGPSESSS